MFGTAVCCVKTAESVDMPFGMSTRVGPVAHIFHGIQVPTTRRGNFEWGHVSSHCQVYRICGMDVAPAAECLHSAAVVALLCALIAGSSAYSGRVHLLPRGATMWHVPNYFGHLFILVF